MLKITPFLHQPTKDKHTSTFDTISNHYFLYANKSFQCHTQSYNNQRSFLDYPRLAKLAEPKINNKKETQCSEPNPYSYTMIKRSLQNAKTLPLVLDKIIQTPFTKPLQNLPHPQTEFLKKSALLNFSKIEQKRPSFKNKKNQQNKENLKLMTSTLRNTQKSKTFMNQSTTFLNNRKLKQEKHKTFDTQKLKSSDLANIYSSLYNKYEQIPFNELQEAQPILVNLMNVLQKQGNQEDDEQKYSKKERKSFVVKQLEFEKSLRKQIKSLTRDTDHILSFEFRDIREVKNR